jgi:predicted phosphodiesterase
MEGLATGDWHFGSLTKHFRNPVQRQIFELNKIYQYAISNGIQHVFVAGDISDTPSMDHDTYIQLVLFLKKYDGLIHTHYIAGNHDFSDIKKTSMDFLKVLVENGFFDSFSLYLTPELVQVDDCPVFFAPYPCLETIKSKRPKLNIAHVTYTGAVGDNGRTLRAKEEFQQADGDFTISGHIHQHQILKSKRALYCGNPYQKTFGESLPKGFVHFKARPTTDKIKFSYRFINSKPDFQLINFHVSSRDDFARLLDSDTVCYKLWLDEAVEVPKDLRLQFSNITGGIFDVSTKKILESDPNVLIPQKRPHLDVLHGLGHYFKSNGFSKAQYLEARGLVESAKNELGLVINEFN